MSIESQTVHVESNELYVSELAGRVKQWRLADCDGETLSHIRRMAVQNMVALEQKLTEAEAQFRHAIETGETAEITQMQEEVAHLSDEWKTLKKRTTEIDNILREQRLFQRVATVLGSERRAQLLEVVVLILIVFVVGIAIADMNMSLTAEMSTIFSRIDLTISLLLLVEFFFRLSLAENKGWFLRRYWIDFAASIPFQEALRFGRLVRLTRFTRLLRFVRFMRFFRVALLFFRGLDSIFEAFNLALMKRSLMLTLLLLFAGALSISFFEGDKEVWLGDFGEGLWWSFATVVTGGWGDIYNPVTTSGRLITALLVLLGLVVTGIFFASLTSILVEDDANELERNQRKMATSLEALQQRLGTLTSHANLDTQKLEAAIQALTQESTALGIAQTVAAHLTHAGHEGEAAVYLWAERTRTLVRIYPQAGTTSAAQREIHLDETGTGHVVAKLLTEPTQHKTQTEPIISPNDGSDITTITYPLLARGTVVGVIQFNVHNERVRQFLDQPDLPLLIHFAALAFYTCKR